MGKMDEYTWKIFEETIRRGRNRSVRAYLVTDDDDDDDEKLHVLGNLILRKHRCENLKYRFELDGFFFG